MAALCTPVIFTELPLGMNGLVVDLHLNTEVCGNKAQVFVCTVPDFVQKHLNEELYKNMLSHTNNNKNLT